MASPSEQLEIARLQVDDKHSDHDNHPSVRKAHNGAHERHITEEDSEKGHLPTTTHPHDTKGGQGGNHDHARNWSQHSHPHAKAAEDGAEAGHHGKHHEHDKKETKPAAAAPEIVETLPQRYRETLDMIMMHPRAQSLPHWKSVEQLFLALGADLETTTGHAHGGKLKIKLREQMITVTPPDSNDIQSHAQVKELQNFFLSAGIGGDPLDSGKNIIYTGGERVPQHDNAQPVTPQQTHQKQHKHDHRSE